MPQLEHPAITRTLATGYPEAVEQPENGDVDFYGTEILEGDIVAEYDGEIILDENLERYLKEEFGFKFNTAK